jgi:hypothetical protein
MVDQQMGDSLFVWTSTGVTAPVDAAKCSARSAGLRVGTAMFRALAGGLMGEFIGLRTASFLRASCSSSPPSLSSSHRHGQPLHIPTAELTSGHDLERRTGGSMSATPQTRTLEGDGQQSTNVWGSG